MGLSTLMRGNLDDKLKWTFRLYDLNEDGVITPNELLDIVTAIYSMVGRCSEPRIEPGTAREHADRIFNVSQNLK